MGKTNTNWDVVEMFKERANAIDHKEHFRLRKYDVTMKEIAKVRYGSHCKYNINFHFVWVPKTRMKILVEPFRTDLINEIYRISEHYKWHPLALEIMPDHVHYFISAHPKWSGMNIVKKLKEESSRFIRAKYKTIRDTRTTPDFWATGYYCGTAGHVSAKQVARYIFEQTAKLKKNWNLFDIEPFEYDINDAKIENKNQTRLNAFGVS